MMLRRELNGLETKQAQKGNKRNREREKIIVKDDDPKIKVAIARFLKSYAVFITDHTEKEDKFFDLIEEKDRRINKRRSNVQLVFCCYEMCKNQIGGDGEGRQMIRLIEYLESDQWMKNGSD